MRTYHYRYPVRLTSEQRRFLETMVHTSRTPAKHYLVARVLLMSDQSQGQPETTDGQIAEALHQSPQRDSHQATVCAREPGGGPHRKLPARTSRASMSGW